MLKSVYTLILIPAFTLGVGFLISLDEDKKFYSGEMYPEHLTGAFTGGFGEQTCHSCHFDYDLNWEEGSLSISGIPDKVQPGETYEFKISVERDDLGKAGFQLTSRFADGSQAGRFNISENKRLMFTTEVPDSIQYIQHSDVGTDPVEVGKNQWLIKWQAPGTIADSIYFNISANAGNGDQSEFGDWIYVRDFVRGSKNHL